MQTAPFIHTPGPAAARCGRAGQRGAASLAISLLLLFAMLMTAASVHRSLLHEQRASANQYRATQAHEAAEAGLEWAIARLNQSQPLNERCEADATAAQNPLRDRLLSPADGSPVATGSPALSAQAGCVRSGDRWACACPASGPPNLPAGNPDADLPQPAFRVQLDTLARPGLLRLTSTGCTSAASPCSPSSAARASAQAQLQVLLGLMPGLSVAPQAALTVRGSIDAGSAALGVHNPDAASGGLTVHAGGSLIGAGLRLSTAAGGAAQASAVTHDDALAALDADRLFAAYFGLDRDTWRRHPGVQAIACNSACGTALAHAIDSAGSNRLIAIDGDTRIDGPLTLGSPERPVLIVVNGAALLSGNLMLHGMLYAGRIQWDDATGPQAAVHGALVSESNYAGNASPDLHRDANVLRALQRQTGSYARVPGSWKDF